MNEIVVLSGKGGTGKTCITAAFASLNKDIVLADCDVDASNMHVIMQPNNFLEESFLTGYKPSVNQDLCSLCGICRDYCRFDAITINDNTLGVSTSACEGCKLCEKICPSNAISMISNDKSRFYIGNFRYGTMVHARLSPGEDNSGKLVSYVKRKAREIINQKNTDILLIDGPPGVGCPVIATLSGASKVVLVTEPTFSGISDLLRIIKLLKKFKRQCYIIVNKCDINIENSNYIKQLAENGNITFLGNIPYDNCFTDAMIKCKSIIEYSPVNNISSILENMWRQLTIK
jgi:MinD superfamily P-loop ATPase